MSEDPGTVLAPRPLHRPGLERGTQDAFLHAADGHPVILVSRDLQAARVGGGRFLRLGPGPVGRQVTEKPLRVLVYMILPVMAGGQADESLTELTVTATVPSSSRTNSTSRKTGGTLCHDRVMKPWEGTGEFCARIPNGTIT
jgi:hypothetical protein